MRKLLAGIVLGFCILIGLSAQATLTISGTVAPKTIITCILFGTVIDIDLETEGLHDIDIATITEISNNQQGYTIDISSSSGATGNPFLKGTGTNTDTLIYSLLYDGQPISFVAGTKLAAKTFNTKTTKEGNSSIVSISYTISTIDNLVTDTYSDQLTFSIAAQ